MWRFGVPSKLFRAITRATRAARYVPGTLVPVEVIDTLPIAGAQFPTVGDLL